MPRSSTISRSHSDTAARRQPPPPAPLHRSGGTCWFQTGKTRGSPCHRPRRSRSWIPPGRYRRTKSFAQPRIAGQNRLRTARGGQSPPRTAGRCAPPFPYAHRAPLAIFPVLPGIIVQRKGFKALGADVQQFGQLPVLFFHIICTQTCTHGAVRPIPRVAARRTRRLLRQRIRRIPCLLQLRRALFLQRQVFFLQRRHPGGRILPAAQSRRDGAAYGAAQLRVDLYQAGHAGINLSALPAEVCTAAFLSVS